MSAIWGKFTLFSVIARENTHVILPTSPSGESLSFSSFFPFFPSIFDLCSEGRGFLCPWFSFGWLREYALEEINSVWGPKWKRRLLGWGMSHQSFSLEQGGDMLEGCACSSFSHELLPQQNLGWGSAIAPARGRAEVQDSTQASHKSMPI